MSQEQPKKMKRERSKAYPGAPLEECVQLVIRIKRNLGSGKHDRESLAQAMGFSGVSGAVAPKIAALAYFGLLDKKGADYWLSDESNRVTDPLNEDEKVEEIRNALRRPSLYEDLLAKFEPDGRVPEQLATHLHRFHGISANAANRAAEIFRESAIYAGVINEEGRFVKGGLGMPSEQRGASTENARTEEKVASATQRSGAAERPQPPTQGSARSYAFPLSGGRAELYLPEELSRKDIEILKKQIEILELEVE